MATERTAVHPFDGVIHLTGADEQYVHPFAGVIDNDIESAGSGAPLAVFLNANKVIE